MLNVVSLASLDSYAKHIEKLVTQWPKWWGLIYAADAWARAEKLEKWRRLLSGEAARGRQVPVDWDPSRPWSCLFMQLTKDKEGVGARKWGLGGSWQGWKEEKREPREAAEALGCGVQVQEVPVLP